MGKVKAVITDVQEIISKGDVLIVTRKRYLTINIGFAVLIIVLWSAVLVCVGGMIEAVCFG